MAGAYGLDFGAVMAVGTARDVDLALLADVLPEVEGHVIASMQGDGEEEEREGE